MMKIKRIEQIKKKRSKLKSRRIKTKLSVEKKRKYSVCQDKTMFTYKDIINSVDSISTNSVQNIPLTDQPVYPPKKKANAPSKIRKKNLIKRGSNNISSFSPQYFMNKSLGWDKSAQQTQRKMNKWEMDNSNKEIQMERNDNWIQNTPKEQRHIDTMNFVEVLSDNLTSLNIPQMFKCERTKTSNAKTSYDNDSFRLDTPSNEEGACVVVADFINPKAIVHMQDDHQKQASSVLSSAKKKDKSKYVDCKESNYININNISDTSNSSAHRKFAKNRNSRIAVDDNSNREMRDTSPQHKNINTNRYAIDRKTPRVYCIRNKVIVIMENDSRFCFTGKLLVKVLYGTIKIYGTLLDKSNCAKEVYSPRGYSNITIETGGTFSDCTVSEIWAALFAEGITQNAESKLYVDINKIQPGMALIVLQNFENNLTRFLTAFCPFRLFPRLKNSSCFYSWTDLRRAEIILQSNLYLEQHDDFNYRRLIIDPYITNDIAKKMLSRWQANEWSCTLIAGGKNVGKSTSVRCLINSLLRTSEKVVLVDVDPGQAECTPSGCISYSLIEEPLMGPNFTHLKTPVYQLYIDDVNVSRCITRYLEGVKMLIEKLKNCPILSHLPIVVNTMGFTQNLGWDIAIITIKLIRPSCILQILSKKKKNNYNDVFTVEVVNKQVCPQNFCNEGFVDWSKPCEHSLCTTYSHADLPCKKRTNELNMEPYQQRELAMISYLSDIIRNSNDSLQHSAKLSPSINETVPYTAPFSSLCIIPQRSFGIPASHALNVINGNIVALCGIDLTEEFSSRTDTTSTLQVLTQRSALCTCYGFGIIRAIDMERQEVYVNTPLPVSIMQHVNCLAGCIPIPPSLLQLNEGAPYVGGNVALPTSRETRRGYFPMRYHKTQNKT